MKKFLDFIDAALYHWCKPYRRWIMRRAHVRSLWASEVVLQRELAARRFTEQKPLH